MTCIFIADARNDQRSFLCLFLQDLKMEVVGEASAVVRISHLIARQQAALSAGADAFISKGKMLNVSSTA